MKIINPTIPINIPVNWIQLELSFSQTKEITNEKRGVVPFKTDIVPAFKSSAASENRKKGIEALKNDRNKIADQSFFKLIRCFFLIKIGANTNEAIKRR